MTLRRTTPVQAATPVPARPAVPPDAGFTLVELLVAIGVFSILMVMVGAATLTGFTAIREASSRSTIQQQSQNAMEWSSRLLRYAEVPEGVVTALPEATSTAVTAYSYTGTGSKADVPYKVRLSVATQADGTQDLVSDVWTPTRVSGGWTYDGAPRRRTLLTVPADVGGSPLSLQYFACTPTAGCAATRRVVTPNASGPLTLGASEVPESIVLSIGDPSLPSSLVTQSVKLVNLS
jgi:prepilin-type N-terminal cleavage/methylation domain-containing protein